MTDIERLKRINQLSQELRKHGIAADSDDAVEQARQAVEVEREVPDVKHVELKPESELYEIKKTVKQEVSRRLQDEQNALYEQLKKMAQTMQRMENRISSLEQQQAQQPVSQPQQSGGEQQSSATTSQSSQPHQKKKEKQQDHPKSGDWNPEEVKVEKFFYYGNK